MQRDRALHIVEEIHVGSLEIMGCLDEYLYLLTGRTAVLVPKMQRPSTRYDRSRSAARSHSYVEPSRSSRCNTKISTFMRSCANE